MLHEGVEFHSTTGFLARALGLITDVPSIPLCCSYERFPRMVGEPLLRIGEDLMGVRLAEEMEPPRGGPGLAGRGWASVDERRRQSEAETAVERERETKREMLHQHV